MKPSVTVLCLVVLALSACRKDNTGKDPSYNYNDVNIAAISDVPAFIYESDRLVAIGNERFTYDDKGRIVGSRIAHRDTLNKLITGYVYKTRFMWVNGLCAGSIADSLYTYVKGLDGSIKNEWFASGTVLSNYDYNLSTGYLSSVSLVPGRWNTAFYTSLKYEYDGKGNVIKIVASQPNPISRPGAPFELITVMTFQYDNHPSPFYAMYKKYGFMLPALQHFATSVSPNNVIKVQMKLDNMVELVQQYTYEYNAAGYPVKMTTNGGSVTGQTTYISYR
ncbi:YD repeat-containing protein [Chitinophaga eiseniae]|uniref:YD repeat-containing protein n=1 Tax=Chitinophaga eiseniae TaxID=634771 RepID=A0A1T4QKM7_9BACT|nr:hypothetical protein [Chitinophaga eiseniae]SKA04265.1 YD repeat-containing protein [Chitinophaga eiseniae]